MIQWLTAAKKIVSPHRSGQDGWRRSLKGGGTNPGRLGDQCDYLLKMAIYSEFSHSKWWFSIVMLVYQRVSIHLESGVRDQCPGHRWWIDGFWTQLMKILDIVFLDFEHHNLNFLLEIVKFKKNDIYQALFFSTRISIWSCDGHLFDWLICVVGV